VDPTASALWTDGGVHCIIINVYFIGLANGVDFSDASLIVMTKGEKDLRPLRFLSRSDTSHISLLFIKACHMAMVSASDGGKIQPHYVLP
jgi:hypothetical protein